MRRVLLIAFHFPPFQGSSGLQRTLSFCRHLPRHGWAPSVLTVDARAYVQSGKDQVGDVPGGVTVRRAFALDAARHLAIRGRYLQATALPDRWVSWVPAGVVEGIRLIRRLRPDVIWSTYPIATAHVIGWALHRLTGLPWVADFRDPMVETIERTGEQFPRDPAVRRARLRVEQLVARRATCAVFCTDSARAIFTARYPQVPPSQTAVIENGFDEAIFSEVEPTSPKPAPAAGRPLVLLHSGVLYRSTDRSPEGLFDALRLLLNRGQLGPDDLRIVLRASGNDAEYTDMIAARRLQALVRLAPQVGYREALAEMFAADALLLFQGYTSNPAVPAKAYEYLRTRRPIFALVDGEGETARLVGRLGAGRIAPMDDAPQIADSLAGLLADLRSGAIRPLADEVIQAHSREDRSAGLARLFDELSGAAGRTAAPDQ